MPARALYRRVGAPPTKDFHHHRWIKKLGICNGSAAVAQQNWHMCVAVPAGAPEQ
jgi:hypothetical protein